MYFIWVRSQSLNYLYFINEGEVKEGTGGHSTFPSQEWYWREDAEILYGVCSETQRGLSTFPNRLSEYRNRKQVVTNSVNWNWEWMEEYFFPLNWLKVALFLDFEDRKSWRDHLVQFPVSQAVGIWDKHKYLKHCLFQYYSQSLSLSAVDYLTLHGKIYTNI